MFDQINHNLGIFIASHPLCYILTSLTIATICTFQLKNIHIENDIRTSFSPLSSRSAYEFSVYKEFYNLSTRPERSSILFSAKDHGSMLRLEHIQDVLKLDKKFMEVLKEKDSNTHLRGCDPLCDLNLPFHSVVKELIKTYSANLNHTLSNSEPVLTLDYPISTLYGYRVFMGMNLIGAQVSNAIFPRNNSKIVSVKTIILWYFARADSLEQKFRLKNISLELFEAAKKGDVLEHVNFEIFGDEIANNEMVRGAIEATMLMSIGFGLLLLFISVTMHRKVREFPVHKIFMVILMSILCPLISSSTAFGIIAWCGMDIYTIMCVTPFLICGIGVDDAFIMLQSWRQHRSTTECPRKRLGIVMMHVGPSIAITSLTNTIAFGIGYATPTPQMSLFCLCTSMAMFINYIFTFSVLAATIVLITPEHELHRTENENISTDDKSKDYTKDISHENLKIEHVFSNSSSQLKNGAVLKDFHTIPLLHFENGKLKEEFEKLNNENGDVQSYVGKNLKISPWVQEYSVFLNSTWGKIIGLFLLSALLTAATFGIVRMKSTFEPSKAFPSDSPLANSLNGIRAVFDEFFPISIFVNRPPNISDSNDYNLFYRMMDDLEALPESYGKNRTLLWLRAYEDFDREAGKLWEFVGLPASDNKSYKPTFDNLDFFLSHLNYPPSIKSVLDKNGTRQLTAFQFIIIAKNMSEWLNRAVVEQKCREILMRYPFNATIYDGDSAVLNLLLTAKIDLVGSILVTVVCMIIICSFFIAHKIGVIIMSLTIASICYIMVGMISWWGADLDPVTIVDVLLATGFSVDFTAHIAHQFYAKRGTSTERIAQALQEMIIPTLESSTSTILCMLPLIFVPTYAIVAFAKTIFVVVAVGIGHGLFFMPLMLCSLSYGSSKPYRILCFSSYSDESTKE